MINCKICNKEFLNNLAGSLTIHIKDEHNLELKDYIIKTEFNDIAPQCACGCGELPNFRRGIFKNYTDGHRSFSYKEKKYTESFGEPKCKECKSNVEFYRGEPRQYCSFKCSGKNAGFSIDETQDTIKKNVKEKYGVDNISLLDSIKEKISNSNKGKTLGRKLLYEDKVKISFKIKEKWNDLSYRIKTSNSIKQIASKEENKLRNSIKMKKQRENPEFLKKRFKNSKNRLSKLHIKIRNLLELDKFGFISEQLIERYFADELNEDKKIIIEINGDYTHANPSKYKPESIIRLSGQSFTAQEKWDSDKIKIENLNKIGYKVLVIWESDNLVEVKNKLYQLLGI